MTIRQYTAAVTAVLAMLVSCGQPTAVSGDPDSPVVINEFMVTNVFNTRIFDEYGRSADWVELYNNGTGPVNLHGYYLSDDAADPVRYRLPDTLLQPGGYYLMFAGSTNTGFGFSADPADEEAVVLADGNGDIKDICLYADTEEARETGKSYGRCPDGGDTWKQQAVPSPDEPNDN